MCDESKSDSMYVASVNIKASVLYLFVVWQFVLRVFVLGDGLLMMTVQLADTGAPLGVMR